MLLSNRFQPFTHPPVCGFPRSLATLAAIKESQGRRLKMALRAAAKLNKPSKKLAFGVDLRNMKKGDHETLKTRLATRAQMAGAVADQVQPQPKRPVTWYEAER